MPLASTARRRMMEGVCHCMWYVIHNLLYNLYYIITYVVGLHVGLYLYSYKLMKGASVPQGKPNAKRKLRILSGKRNSTRRTLPRFSFAHLHKVYTPFLPLCLPTHPTAHHLHPYDSTYSSNHLFSLSIHQPTAAIHHRHLYTIPL